jgi:hypothetical protein
VARIPGLASVLRALFVVYVLEAGAFLTLAPWSRYWNLRVVARSPGSAQALLASSYFRSFLLGLGVIHLWAAASEIERWRREPRVAVSPRTPEEPA